MSNASQQTITWPLNIQLQLLLLWHWSCQGHAKQALRGLAGTFGDSINCSECVDFTSLISTEEPDKRIQMIEVSQNNTRHWQVNLLSGSTSWYQGSTAHSRKKNPSIIITGLSPFALHPHGMRNRVRMSPWDTRVSGLLPVLQITTQETISAMMSATPGSVSPPSDIQAIRLLSFVPETKLVPMKPCAWESRR